MPFGKSDVSLTVAEDGGEATSDVKLATYIYNFSMKVPDNRVWSYQMLDQDGYIIAQSDGPITGPIGIPIERRIQNFTLRVFSATAGAYLARFGIDS